MIIGNSRVILRHSFVWICLFGLTNYSAIAKAQVPITKSVPPAVEQTAEVEPESTPAPSAIPAINQTPEAEKTERDNASAAPADKPSTEAAPSPDVPASSSADQIPEVDTPEKNDEPVAAETEQPSEAAPVPVPDAPADEAEEQATESETTETTTAPTVPLTEKPSEATLVPAPNAPAAEAEEQATESETTETTTAPTVPLTEQPSEATLAPAPDAPAAQAEEQATESETTETTATPTEPSTEQLVEVAPAPVPDTPEALTEGQAPEADAAETTSTPAAPEVEQPSEAELAPTQDAPAAQSEGETLEADTKATTDEPGSLATDPQSEGEPASPPDAPAPKDEKQKAENQTVTTESRPLSGGKKSVFKRVFSNATSTFTLTTGMREDDFKWSIAGDIAGANPNILSELTWSDVNSYEVAFANRTIFNRILYLRSAVNYAFIQDGRIQDSDYRLDNRGDEFSRSISESSGDQLWGASLAAGYPFFFMQDRLMVAPLLGYAYDAQNFRITDGEQVITWPAGPALGPLSGLNSTYRSNWQGPWIGFDLRYRPSQESRVGKRPMEFGLSVEYHDVEYEAEANWNLRSDFQHPVSFEHFADGQGITLAGEWLIGLTAHWDLVFQASYQSWKTDNGLDRVYRSDSTVGESRLNEVEWSNHSILVGASFRF